VLRRPVGATLSPYGTHPDKHVCNECIELYVKQLSANAERVQMNVKRTECRGDSAHDEEADVLMEKLWGTE
jgi:hypothetical protein